MKKFIICLIFIAGLLLDSCKKDGENSLSDDDQKAIAFAMFNAGANSLTKSRNTRTNAKQNSASGTANVATAISVPVNNDFEYDFPDTHGGSMHLTVDTGGYTQYDDKTYACLGAFLIINVAEKINHYTVDLTNGRSVYIDSDPTMVYSGNFYILPGCSTFDTTKSFFRISGTYRCNGIGYDVALTTGKINADGTCQEISGLINGRSVDFVF